jgi:hypothetical protein
MSGLHCRICLTATSSALSCAFPHGTNSVVTSTSPFGGGGIGWNRWLLGFVGLRHVKDPTGIDHHKLGMPFYKPDVVPYGIPTAWLTLATHVSHFITDDGVNEG